MEFKIGPVYFLKVISYRDEEIFAYLVGKLCNILEFLEIFYAPILRISFSKIVQISLFFDILTVYI
jgi:hypothetical protein